MLCSDAYPILLGKRIDRLYHANSVTTSQAFLSLGGLASRARVEREGLTQTTQYTDPVDRQWRIWNDVFTDSVDIHDRASRHNQYGPVLFELDTQVLLDLPADVEVHFTRSNPTKWLPAESYEERYFATPPDLAAGLGKGTFDHMITFRSEAGLVPFGQRLLRIILDQPSMNFPDGTTVFDRAANLLQSAAQPGNVATPIQQRACRAACRCVAYYHGQPTEVQRMF